MTLNFSQMPTLRAGADTKSLVENDAAIEKTIAGAKSGRNTESCIVQIYPPNVVDGMIKLESSKVILGRDQSVDCVLSDNSVSRKHSEIVTNSAGKFEVRDLGSTNGTLVNGQQVQLHELRSGDTIQIGCFQFRYLSAGSVESQYHETVYTALTRDTLTGTMNRRYMLESLKRELARSSRRGDTLTVVMLDIDNFKSVNDTYGHLVGDEVLQGFGQRIASLCRGEDMFARFGGEEFCMALADAERPGALKALERFRKGIADLPFSTEAGEISITASFGFVCVAPATKQTINEILEAADEKLYSAKELGRNRICG